MKKRILISIIVIIFLIVGAVFYFSEKSSSEPGINDIADTNIDELFKDDSRTGENEEIKNLFVDDGELVIYLNDNILEVSQGESYGVGFGFFNLLESQSFSWKIKMIDIDPSEFCEMDNINLISSELEGNSIIKRNNKFTDTIKFDIPKNIIKGPNNCLIDYELIVKKENGEIYDTQYFEVDIR